MHKYQFLTTVNQFYSTIHNRTCNTREKATWYRTRNTAVEVTSWGTRSAVSLRMTGPNCPSIRGRSNCTGSAGSPVSFHSPTPRRLSVAVIVAVWWPGYLSRCTSSPCPGFYWGVPNKRTTERTSINKHFANNKMWQHINLLVFLQSLSHNAFPLKPSLNPETDLWRFEDQTKCLFTQSQG